MMTVSEVSRLTGVSIRTLQYYDKIGLLHPNGHTEAGYRLYDDTALAALQQILLFREMEFPLKDIRQIMTQPGFDRQKALTQQMELLMLKKQRLENLIDLARKMQQTGGKPMDFTAFDTTKLEEYAHQAKQAWGTTPEYQEFEGKSAKRTPQESNTINAQLMAIVAAAKCQKSAAIHPDWISAGRISSPGTITPAISRFWPSWGRCTRRAVSLPKTSTPQAAPVRQNLPPGRLNIIAGEKKYRKQSGTR